MKTKKEATIVMTVEITAVVPLPKKLNQEAEIECAKESMADILNDIAMFDDVNVKSIKTFVKDS